MGEPGGICTLTHIFGAAFRSAVDNPQERPGFNDSLADAFADMGLAPLAVTNKAALNLIGIEVGGPRLPYVPLDAEETNVIRAMLDRHGLLQAASVS
jgi:dihydrodipicolinate synthase/N-acetylneuraminate lyase